MLPELTFALSRGKNPSGISPCVRFGHRLIEVLDECLDRLLKRFQARKAHQTSHLATQRSEPDLNLVQPRTMPWREQKLNAMTWIGQEGDTTRNRLQNAPNAFLAKVLVNATTRRDVTNTGLAAVSRQVVGDQAVASIGIHAHQCVDVFEVVFLGSRLTQHRRKDLAGRNMKVSKQAQRAVTDVLVFAKHRHSRPSTTIRRDSLECLDSCLFVDADRVDSFAEVEVDRVTIGGTDGADTRVKTWVQFVFAGQPVLVFVRSNLCAPQQLANPATTNSRHDTVGDQLQRKFAMRPLGDWAIALGRIFAGFLKDRRLLFFSHNSLPTSPRQVGKQSNDFLFQNMGLLRAFDLDQSRPMVSPPSPPNTDGIVMQSDRLLDRLVVVAIKCQKDDLAPLSQRNARRLCFGDFLQNGLLFLGHDDLGCLPWHGDTFKENGQNRQFSVNLNSKQDQLVPAALAQQLARWRSQTNDPLLDRDNLYRLKTEVTSVTNKKTAKKKGWNYPEYFFAK